MKLKIIVKNHVIFFGDGGHQKITLDHSGAGGGLGGPNIDCVILYGPLGQAWLTYVMLGLGCDTKKNKNSLFWFQNPVICSVS